MTWREFIIRLNGDSVFRQQVRDEHAKQKFDITIDVSGLTLGQSLENYYNKNAEEFFARIREQIYSRKMKPTFVIGKYGKRIFIWDQCHYDFVRAFRRIWRLSLILIGLLGVVFYWAIKIYL